LPGAPSTDERLVCCALGDQDQRPFGGSGIELAWRERRGFRIGHHLVPMGNPPTVRATAKTGVNIAGGSPKARKMMPE